MFDTPEELRNKIRLGENSLLELKAVTVGHKGLVAPHPESLAQEIAAFANSRHGGVLVLGVEDRTKEITGFTPEECAAVDLAVRGILNDRIDPPALARQQPGDPARQERQSGVQHGDRAFGPAGDRRPAPEGTRPVH